MTLTLTFSISSRPSRCKQLLRVERVICDMAGRPPSLIFVIWNGPRNHAKENFYGYRPLLKEIRRFAIFQYLSRLLPLTAMLTRSSATAEVPRDAPCQSKSCQLLHNSVGTTGTTSPEQIEVMELEGYSRPTCSKLCSSSHDALDRRRCNPQSTSFVVHKIDLPWPHVPSPQFGGKVPEESVFIIGFSRISSQHNV